MREQLLKYSGMIPSNNIQKTNVEKQDQIKILLYLQRLWSIDSQNLKQVYIGRLTRYCGIIKQMFDKLLKL